MRSRVALKVAEFAPLLAATLLALVWFSTPGPLRGQMLSMAASGVPIESALYSPDRMTAASSWLEADVRAKAAKGWADARFKSAADETSRRMAYRFVEAAAVASATPYMIPDDENAFAPLKKLVSDFPDVHVDAYVVESPAMPPVVGGGGVPLGHLPSSPFAAAWTASVGMSGVSAFDPKAWNGFSANATDSAVAAGWRVGGDNDVYSYSWLTKDALLYRAYAFVPPRELLGARTAASIDSDGDYPILRPLHKRLETKLKSKPPGYAITGEEDDVSATWCHVCHPDHKTSAEKVNGAGQLATALWIGGPVKLAPKAQFTTRSKDRSAALVQALVMSSLAHPNDDYFPTPASVSRCTSDPFTSAVWVQPRMRVGSGQTMFFVATYPADPHAAFTAWRASWVGNTVMSLRLWLALQFPWLLAFGSALLGVSLFASPLAFVTEHRWARREEIADELARLERDAHDRVYNRLGALSKRVEDVAGNGVHAENGDLGSVATDIRATVADLQAILGGDAERGGELAGDALLSQLRATAAAQATLHNVAVDLSAPSAIPVMPARLGWDLQCVLDEAISNASRHGHASRLQASLTVTSETLLLVVTDDGVVVPATDPEARRSTGLLGMRERLGAWGGDVTLERGPIGSTLTASVPMPPRRRGRGGGA